MTAAIEIDPRGVESRAMYHLLASLVVPRPIAWVSTLGADGTANLAPFSFFTIVANEPPHIAFSVTSVRDTLVNIRATGELVVNLVARPQLELMAATSVEVGPEIDEFTSAGIATAPSRIVSPPRVAAARAHLECRAVSEVPVGDSHLVIAEVVHVHVDPAVLRGDRVDPVLLDPIARLGGANFTTLGTVVRAPRLSRHTVITRKEE